MEDLQFSYGICGRDGKTDPDVSRLDVSWQDILGLDVSWTGHFVSGLFLARQFVTRRFVGPPMKILPYMPYALR